MKIFVGRLIILYLSELVVAQVEFLQSGPFVDGSTQVQFFDAVLTEHQLSEVAGLPETRTRQSSNVVGSHVHRPQAGWREVSLSLV